MVAAAYGLVQYVAVGVYIAGEAVGSAAQGFGFFEDAACCGLAEAEDGGDVADGLALAFEVEDVLHLCGVLLSVPGPEVLLFGGVAYGLEVEEAVSGVMTLSES